jgi:hypothetical protein
MQTSERSLIESARYWPGGFFYYKDKKGGSGAVVEYLHSCLAGPGIDRLLAYNARERLRRKHHRGSLRRSIFRIPIQLSGGLGGS